MGYDVLSRIRTIHIRCNICADSCLINIIAIKIGYSHEKKISSEVLALW